MPFKKSLAGVLVLFILSACNSSMDHGTGHGEEHTHSHSKTIELTDASPLPSVDLKAHKDPKSGWNIQVTTENFRFAPERASTDHVEGEGHAHLYVDGEKITRLYGEWYHLDVRLEAGEHELRVNLNANSHAPFSYQGEEIQAIATILVE